MSTSAVRAHFVAMALLDADDGIEESIEARRALLKAAVAAGGEGAGRALIAALEGFVCSEVEDDAREAAISGFDKTLRALWEWEVCDEEEIRAWQPEERIAANLKGTSADGRRMHERGLAFLEWVERGEE